MTRNKDAAIAGRHGHAALRVLRQECPDAENGVVALVSSRDGHCGS